MRFRLSSTLKRLLMETKGYDAFFPNHLQKPPFSALTKHPTKRCDFKKAPLLKLFSKDSIFISVFGRLSVDDVEAKMHQKVRMRFQNKMSLCH